MAPRDITRVFPAENEVPERFRFGAPLNQDSFLIDGEMRSWQGPFQSVESPVRIRTDN